MSEPVLTVAAMRAAEQRAMAGGTSEWELMRRAGEGAAEWVWRMSGGRAVTVLCGPGNNGGDGYVIAESLCRRGSDVAVIAPLPPSGDTALRARREYGGPVSERWEHRGASVLVDALFGYGLTREVSGAFAELLEKAHANHGFKTAIDIPSGVESDTGKWLGRAYRYDLTLALGAWKRAHWLMPASPWMGRMRLVPIGLELEAGAEVLSARPVVAAPPPDSHKYRRGLLAVVAGAMPGAPVLACEAAMRAGAGYVKLLSETAPAGAPADLVVESGDIFAPLADSRMGAVLIGPGLGRGEAACRKLARVLDSGHPCVIDADALHLLDWDLLEGIAAADLVLTPHDGELAALCESFGVMAGSRLDRTQQLSDVIGANILAKGPDSLLATSDGRLVHFPRASSWLSVAGSGDVLAGIIASRLAGHGDPALAVEEGMWLHREAAQLAGPAFTAGQLAHAVQPALARLL